MDGEHVKDWSGNLLTAVIIIGVLLVALALSYLLALTHEPQSYWLWHDILRVIR